MKQEHGTLTEQIFTSGSVIVFFSLIAAPLGYLTRIIFSRSLSIEDFGLMYALVSLFSLLAAYTDLGLGRALTYFAARFQSQGKHSAIWVSFLYTLFVSLAVAAVVAGLAFALRDPLSRIYFKNLSALQLLPIFCLFLLIETLILAVKNLLIGLRKAVYYSSLQPLRLVFTFLWAGSLFLMGKTSINDFSLSWVLASLSAIVFLIVWIAIKHGLPPFVIVWNKQLLGKLLHYALPSVAVSFIQQLSANADVIILTALRNVNEVAVYNIAFPIIVLPSIVFSPLTRLFFPLVSSLQSEAGGKEKTRQLIESVLKIIPFLTLYFNTFVFIFARSTITTLFTNKWVSSAELPLMLMSLGYLSFTVGSYLSVIIDGLGLLKEKIKITTSLAILNILLSVVMTHFFGLVGLVIAGSISQTAFALGFLRLLSKHAIFSIPFGHYARYTAFFLFITFFVKLFGYEPKTLGGFLITGIVYSFVVAAFGHKLELVDPQSLYIIREKIVRIIRRQPAFLDSASESY